MCSEQPPPEAAGAVSRARRLQLNEDWIATIVGLGLLALSIAGVITPDLVP